MQNSQSVTSNKRHVAIFGAGFSGLVMAHECLKNGFEVSIFEISTILFSEYGFE